MKDLIVYYVENGGLKNLDVKITKRRICEGNNRFCYQILHSNYILLKKNLIIVQIKKT